MFVKHPQLKQLTVSAEKIAHLHAASSCVQLAFPGYPPQLCQAYLLRLSGAQKELILVAYYLVEQRLFDLFCAETGRSGVAAGRIRL